MLYIFANILYILYITCIIYICNIFAKLIIFQIQQYFQLQILLATPKRCHSGFFCFSHNILYWFYVNGEILKVIYDDIYNRITKFKAKNKIMKMSSNYSNVEKRIWTNVHEHHAHDKNNAGYVNVRSFPQQIQCHCKMRKCVDEQLCANVQSLVTKQSIFVSKLNSMEKETSKIFDCTR